MDIYYESASWMWGISLIVVTITIHAIGVVSMALGMIRIRLRLEVRHLGLRYVMPTVIGVVAVIGLLLTVLHGIEAAIWAAAYLWLGTFQSSFDAMLFSLGSMTTIGAPGLVLQRHWQMMGVLEAASGALLFGISTAYIFGVMQVYWPLLRPRA
jgi:ion channel